MRQFKNLLDLQKTFHSEEICREQLTLLRWPNGVICCPFCGTEKHYKLKDGKTYEYLVKWAGLDHEENCWVVTDHFYLNDDRKRLWYKYLTDNFPPTKATEIR